jgi:hypothetical protein
MAKTALDSILSAFRAGASEFNERAGDTVSLVADSVSRVLDEAGSEGAKIRKALVRNWTAVTRPRSSRTVPILLGVVALTAAAAWLASRQSQGDERAG